MRRCFLCLIALTLPAAAQPSHLVFNPPDGTRYTEVFVQTTLKETGESVSRTEILAITRELHFARTADGYIVSVTPLDAHRTINGRTAGLGPAASLLEAPLAYRISGNGEFLSVSGYESQVDALAARGLRVRVDGLVGVARTYWNTQFGDLAGLLVQGDEAWSGRGRYTVKQGVEIDYGIHTRLVDTLSDGQPRMQVVSKFTSGDTRTGAHAQLSGQATRTVDPKTLLPYADREEKRITLPPHVISPNAITLTERRETTYTYR